MQYAIKIGTRFEYGQPHRPRYHTRWSTIPALNRADAIKAAEEINRHLSYSRNATPGVIVSTGNKSVFVNLNDASYIVEQLQGIQSDD